MSGRLKCNTAGLLFAVGYGVFLTLPREFSDFSFPVVFAIGVLFLRLERDHGFYAQMFRLTAQPEEAPPSLPIDRIPDSSTSTSSHGLIDPRWLTSNVIELARTINDTGAYDRLPILADALMDAGCADERILAHCREARSTSEGFWVIDLILGRSSDRPGPVQNGVN